MSASLCISNLAWTSHNDHVVAKILQKHQIRHIEVAPAKINSKPIDITEAIAKQYKTRWLENGVSIVAMQALVFGGPAALLFGRANDRAILLKYLFHIITVAHWLGASVLVFGSPKLRFSDTLDATTKVDIARDFFDTLGKFADVRGIRVCIEPNPRYYGCNFLNSSFEVLDFVDSLNNDGIGLHLDTGAMQIDNEVPAEVIEYCGPNIQHVHISNKDLKAIAHSEHPEFHQCVATVLEQANYSNYLSIEMLSSEYDELGLLERSIVKAKALYRVI